MLDRVYNWIKENNMINDGDTVLCAVSGGVDSVVMTHMMYQLAPRLNIKVHGAHFNHHVRPAEETNADEDFARRFCMKTGVTFHVGHGDVYGRVKKTGETVEEAARILRYEFLQKCLPGAKIATAHHADDNLETMLMRLIRGCGSKGIAGIPPVRDNIIRPVMCLSREEIEQYARENNLDWVTDSTNKTDDYLRNRIRHHIIPLMKAENNNVTVNSVKTAAAIRNETKFIEETAQDKMCDCSLGNGIYSIDEIRGLSKPIMDKVVMNILYNNGVEYSHEDVTKLIKAFDNYDGMYIVNLSGNRSAVLQSGKLRFRDTNLGEEGIESAEIKSVWTYWNNKSIERIKIDSVDEISKDPYNLMINANKISGKIIVRSMMPGDKIKMPGGTKSIGRVLKERGVYAEIRHLVPVFCDDNGVIAVSGIGINMDYKVEIGEPAIYLRVWE